MQDQTLTIGDSALETVLEEFGFGVASDGLVVDSEGNAVPDTEGDEISIEEVGGIAKVNGEPVPIRQDVVSLSNHVERQFERGSE